MTTAEIAIEAMGARDLDEVDAIERQSFKVPWPRQVFADELDRTWARMEVARLRDRVVGFVDYWLVADEVHLLAIATHPDWRRRGIGALLLDRVLAVARQHAASIVTLEVRRNNIPALAMYERRGFRRVGTRPRYYQEDGEDAVVMTLDLGSGSSPGTPSP